MNPMTMVIPAGIDYEIPDEDTIFYVASQKGWIINTPTLFGNARVLSNEHPSHLPELKESFILNDLKLPVHILTQFHDFARKNFEATGAECSAYITCNPETSIFRLFIPEQYVSHTSVNHKLDAGAVRAPYQTVGTIHSHCDFGAFHSGTDTHDMGKMPGLHITIGHVDRDDPEFVFALAVSNAVFAVERDAIVNEGITHDRKGWDTAPDWWQNFVHTGTAPWGVTGITTSYRAYSPPKPHKKNGHKHTPWTGYEQNKHITNYDWDMDETDGWGVPYKPPMFPTATDHQQTLFEEREAQKDAFEDHANLVDFAERAIESEAIHLALAGFHLSYNIIHNPKRAETYLNSQGVFYEAGTTK